MYRKAQSLPPSFVRRLGSTGDPFFSGVFEAGGFRIGFIRIPNYSLTNTTAAFGRTSGFVPKFRLYCPEKWTAGPHRRSDEHRFSRP